MKAIIIQDSNGHVNAYEYSLANLFALLRVLLEENNNNTILENEEGAKKLLESPSTTEAHIESWVNSFGPTGRSRGNIVNIVEVKTEIAPHVRI
jgi:hypothetical protein